MDGDDNENGPALRTLDVHGDIFDSHLSEEIKKKIFEQCVKNTFQEMKRRGEGWGNMPQSMIAKIEEIVKRVDVPWQRILQKCVATASKMKMGYTFSRPNRTLHALGYGLRSYMNPEIMTIPNQRVTVMADISGSMSDRLLAQINEQLKYLHKQEHDIYVIYADTVIQREEIFKPQKGLVRYGSGGTCFIEACERARQLKADINIYFTDSGGSYPDLTQMPNPKKMIWAVTEEANMVPKGLGRVVLMIDPGDQI